MILCLSSLNMIISRSILVSANGNVSFFFITNTPLYIPFHIYLYMCVPHLYLFILDTLNLKWRQIVYRKPVFSVGYCWLGLPWWLSGKEFTCQCRRHGFDPGLDRSPGEGNGNPFQYSCQENPMNRGAWQATVHGVAELDMTSNYY